MYVRLSHDILLLLLICFKYMVHCVMSILYNYVEQVQNRVWSSGEGNTVSFFIHPACIVQNCTLHTCGASTLGFRHVGNIAFRAHTLSIYRNDRQGVRA